MQSCSCGTGVTLDSSVWRVVLPLLLFSVNIWSMICPGIGLGSCLTVWYKEYLCILGFIAFPEDLYTPVIPVTRWTVPACLSYLHREGNLVSKRAICKIFGNVLLVCFIVFFLKSLGFEVTGMVENGLNVNLGFEWPQHQGSLNPGLRAGAGSSKLRADVYFVFKSLRRFKHLHCLNFELQQTNNCQDLPSGNSRIGSCPSVHLKNCKWLSFW